MVNSFDLYNSKCDNMNKEEIRKMAEEHWKYTEMVCKMFYIEAFVHGYGHGCEDTKKEKKNE